MSDTPAVTPVAAAPVSPDAVPRLAPGVKLREDKVRGQTVLLGPERTLGLDTVAAAIVGALDGTRTVAGVIDHLAAAYNAPRETIETDVMAFLTEMRDRKLLEVGP